MRTGRCASTKPYAANASPSPTALLISKMRLVRRECSPSAEPGAPLRRGRTGRPCVMAYARVPVAAWAMAHVYGGWRCKPWWLCRLCRFVPGASAGARVGWWWCGASQATCSRSPPCARDCHADGLRAVRPTRIQCEYSTNPAVASPAPICSSGLQQFAGLSHAALFTTGPLQPAA